MKLPTIEERKTETSKALSRLVDTVKKSGDVYCSIKQDVKKKCEIISVSNDESIAYRRYEIVLEIYE